jgi:cyanate lyase
MKNLVMGLCRAIDFSMDLQREDNPAGDRVKIVLSGKFSTLQTLLNQHQSS